MAEAIFNATASRGSLITWNLTDKDPEGAWVNASEFPVKTVVIEGGQATLYGAMSKEGQEFELRDAYDNPIASPSIFLLKMNPLFMRPKLIVVGSERAEVTVSIFGSK